jgi:hypothetical protein
VDQESDAMVDEASTCGRSEEEEGYQGPAQVGDRFLLIRIAPVMISSDFSVH